MFYEKKLLGIHIDDKINLMFESLCQKPNKKLNGLSLIKNHMKLPKRHILINVNASLKSRCSYGPAL